MARLIFSLENRVLNEIQLNKARTAIGRRPTNDIQIDNLAISGEHAAILNKSNEFYIEDLDSTNGTEVNGDLVKSHLLQTDDVITFGKYQLKFINDTKLTYQTNADGSFEKTIMIRSPKEKISSKISNNTEIAGTNLQVNEITSEEISPLSEIGKIQVLNGSNVGRELILNKALTTLGKVGIQVAVITKRPNGYFITHVEGKVFPVINGVASGAQTLALNNHDVIELAGVKMEFYLGKL